MDIPSPYYTKYPIPPNKDSYALSCKCCIKQFRTLCNFIINTVNVIKFLILFTFCFQINCWFLVLELTKCLSANREDTDQTASSDQDLRCLSRPFWQVTSVPNIIKFTAFDKNSVEPD